MKNQKEFMLMFRFEPNNNYQPTEIELAEQHQQWGVFIGNIAIQEKLVSTHQLGFEGNTVNKDRTVVNGIQIAENLTLGGNLVLKASGLDEATEIAKNCPILNMGGNVEIREIIPMN